MTSLTVSAALPTSTPAAAAGAALVSARAAADQALWRMMSFYGQPLDDLQVAVAQAPQWALPHLMEAGYLLSLTDPALRPQAGYALARAETLLGRATGAERVHFDALRLVLQGRWRAAVTLWDSLLLQDPRDALALQWAHLWDFYSGDAVGLRQRPARALAQWAPDEPLYAHVLALHAFGLEECNLFAQAEELGRRALQIEPRAPWAVHAVAHVMDMQGRHEDGGAWLRQHQAAWMEGNGFACHLWWHHALFRLEALDSAGVLRLVDKHLSGESLVSTLQRVDAAALLWRLHLLGHDMSAAFATLAHGWPMADDEPGHSLFNDAHRLIAWLGCADMARAERWVARCAEAVLAPGAARSGHSAAAREVGLPLLRSLLAFARGDFDLAAQGFYALRPQAHQLGGSHVQRDLIDQTLLAAAVRASATTRQSLGRALVNERVWSKPGTPLTRHWVEALGCAGPEFK